MDGASIESILRSTPLGVGIPTSVCEHLAGLGTLRELVLGTAILTEGSETTELGIVSSGRLSLSLLIPERGPTTILTVEPGDVFGWSAIVPPHRATSTVVAVEAGEALCFEAEPLRAALAEDKDLAAHLYPWLTAALARRLEGTRLQLLDVFGRADYEPW